MEEDKINSFLRSIFRYKRMLAKCAPDELITMEKKILRDRTNALSVEEVFEAVTSWEGYYEESCINEEIQDEKIVREINIHLQTLN